MKKKVIIIITISVIVIIGGGVALFFKISNSINVNSPTPDTTNAVSTNVNTAENANADTNQPSIGNIVSTSDTTMTGTVFVKGYGTPSESYGILSTDNYEVGLEKYDSMKEQFRAYIGDKVTVTFSEICRSTSSECCRTVFYYCGTVKTWEPLDTNP
ncbi:MAG: hypothetical protein WC544_04890 [Patescibacteria group bacterium]